MVEVLFLQNAWNQFEVATWERKESQIESSAAVSGHSVAQEHPESKTKSPYGGQTALQAARRPNARQRAHPQAEVAGRHVHEQPFENIAVPTQMSPAHPARLIEVSIGPL